MRRYVLGFMFSPDLWQVLLIRKEKPSWQAGLLNGIGGKIEPGEMPLAAMVREFREETGLDTDPCDWHAFGRMGTIDGLSDSEARWDLSDDEWIVHCFTCTSSDYDCAKPMESEMPVILHVSSASHANRITGGPPPLMRNVPTMVQAARQRMLGYDPPNEVLLVYPNGKDDGQ